MSDIKRLQPTQGKNIDSTEFVVTHIDHCKTIDAYETKLDQVTKELEQLKASSERQMLNAFQYAKHGRSFWHCKFPEFQACMDIDVDAECHVITKPTNTGEIQFKYR